MAQGTVLGLPIEIPDDLRTPLGAVIVVKALDGDDEIAYFITKTTDVTRVEATGMLITASDEFRVSLADVARDPDSG
jgi:hypothetical protein